MSARKLTDQEETERAELLHLTNKFEAWRNGRTSYRTEEVPAHLAHLDNAKRSRLEVLDFIADPPEKYFAYCQTHPIGKFNPTERISFITTWMGDTLATVTWEGEDFADNFGGKRANFRCVGINGATYSGTYYKSSGNYCRLKRTK